MTKQCPSCGLQEPLVSFTADRKKCKTCRHHERSLNKYNITSEDYDRMYAEQGGTCAICKTHQTKLTRRLDIDHDHETGQVRGLLCSPCNTGLGKFYDNEDNLQSAIEYLRAAANRLQGIPTSVVESVGTTISD